MELLLKLSRLDRRWIFLFIALAVTLPFLFPVELPTRPSSATAGVFNAIEKLPENSVVLVSFDYGPSTAVELEPMAHATLRQLFAKNVKVVAVSISPEGAFQSRKALNGPVEELKRKVGVDWVNLGYIAGADKALRAMGSSFPAAFARDIDGRALNQLPIWKRVKNYDSFELILDWSSGYPGALEYIKVVSAGYKRPLGVGVTAVTVPEYFPYLNSGQVIGMLGGLRGAAEYEVLVKQPGTAAKAMVAQNVAHFTIAGFILFANIVYFLGKRR